MWFCGWGMLQVLFSWLVVGELQAREELVGLAQLALVLPALSFLLIGGAVADRLDRRRLLVGLQLTACALAAALAAAVWAGALTFSLLIAFALTMGTVSAFSFPARDALLYDVAGENLMRAVTGITLIQFVGQGVGQLLAGSARYVGTPTALALESMLFLVGTLGFVQIPLSISVRAQCAEPVRAAELVEGIREVVGSPILRPVWLLVMAVGLFFMGAGALGSPLTGFLAGQLGTLGTFRFCGIAMLVFVALVCLFTDIWAHE